MVAISQSLHGIFSSYLEQKDQPGINIDIGLLAKQLREELEQVSRSSTSSTAQSVIIGRVPVGTRNIDPGEYDPQHVSIGPYHYPRKMNLHLRREHDKLVSVAAVLKVAPQPGTVVEAYLDALALLEDRARGCYGDDIVMTSEEFVRMLLLDGCYILSSFYEIYHTVYRHDALSAVVADVFYLAENQIPFFVLEKIDELTSNLESDGDAPATNKIKHPATNKIKQYAFELLKQRKYTETAPEMVGSGNLLRLLHMQLKPVTGGGCGGGGGKQVGRWRTATAYHLAGVKLKSRNISTSGDVRCILDVKLESGSSTLEIPVFNIDGETLRLLRNLMALEQHNMGTEVIGSHVTAYCIFMSQLACEAKDVELLSRRGIIVHTVGNNKRMAEYFADLCRGIEFNPDDPASNYLRMTWQELEERSRSRRQRWVAWLMQKYFSNPWLAVGLMAAVVGLTCAVIQALYSVLSYSKEWN